MIIYFIVIGVSLLVVAAAVGFSVGVDVAYKDLRKISEAWIDEISVDLRKYGINPPPNPFRQGEGS